MNLHPAPSRETGAPAHLRLGLVLGLVVAAQFVLQLDFSIVNIALPTIKRELNFAPADLQWIVTGYALTFGSLLLLGGRVGDRFGHRRVLLTGLAMFGVASLTAGLAPVPLALIVSRFFQGASAAFVAPQALAIITDLFDEGPARTRALGFFRAPPLPELAPGWSSAECSLSSSVGGRSFRQSTYHHRVGHRHQARLPTQTRRTGARLDIAGAVLATARSPSLFSASARVDSMDLRTPARWLHSLWP